VSFVLEVKIRIKPDQSTTSWQAGRERERRAQRAGLQDVRRFRRSERQDERDAVRGLRGREGLPGPSRKRPHFKKYLAEAIPLLASRERKVLAAGLAQAISARTIAAPSTSARSLP
jgi:hypothetical protein